MPFWSMCSNSCFATRSRSGAKRRGLAYTGAPAVLILCVTVCLIGVSPLFVFVNDGKSLKISSYRLDGMSFSTVSVVDLATFEMKPLTSILVFASTSCVRRMSTSRSTFCRKSAPRIRYLVSAIVKIHGNTRQRPRFNVMDV